MGVSIDYNAKIEEKHKAKIEEVIDFIEHEAKKHDLNVYRYVDIGRYELMRLYDMDGKIEHQWWGFNGNDKSDRPDTERSYKTMQIGVFVDYPTSESFTVSFTHNKIDKTYDLSESTKTQVFNKNEMGNIGFHIWIINVLLMVKEKFNIDIDIQDGGNYYFTEKQRHEHMEYLLNRYKKHPCYSKEQDMKYVKRWRKMVSFDIRNLVTAMGENLTVIDNLDDIFKKTGWEKYQIVKASTLYDNKKTVTICSNKK